MFTIKVQFIQESENFLELKKMLIDSADIKEVMMMLCKDRPHENAVMLTFSDLCLSEISRIDVKSGPLVDFPPSVNENVYSKAVQFGIESCPNLMGFVTNIVVRKGEPVLPSDVLKIVTLFSSICYASNQDLDGLGKQILSYLYINDLI